AATSSTVRCSLTANLALGRIVVADSVNPEAESRAGWHAVAASVSSQLVEVGLSALTLPRTDAGSRNAHLHIPGLSPPTWQSVATHYFEPWSDRHFIVDTTRLAAAEASAAIEAHISSIIIQLE
ncbi:MAG: hypothetical protein ACP5RC_08105, partial [Halothiobacillaceae bacterium]